MANAIQLDWDLSDPSVFDAGIPQEAFRELRQTPGLAWNKVNGSDTDGFWSVGRLDDVAAVSRDTELYSSAVGHIQIYSIDDDALDARASMIDMDPPMHTRLRGLVNRGFIPRALERYVSTVRERVIVQLDQLESDGGGDWVEIVSKPIPIGIICDLLGVPSRDRNLMIELTDHLVAGTSARPLDPNAYGNTISLRLLPFNSPAAYALQEYARVLGEERRREPKDDLVSQLIHADVHGEHLSESEYTNFFRLLIFAGNETTRTAMSHLALLIAEHPDLWAAIRDDRTLVPNAVEEVVRYASPILYFRRTATRDTVLSGTHVSRGDKVVMWYASANFDEAHFDDPLRFDPTRPMRPFHAGFGGGGVHTCLGAGLARIELTQLINEILDRGLKLDLAESPEYVSSNFVNGVEKLMVGVRR
ncbi:cytochrome P450 [Mycobacterium frederiksbergense]|uniref:Cytochrome P450 n=1 Tax=Mycolicibacterium frederiksbergense TaxID=117567 RepID=A0ABT6L6R6_9MYCO|nr:cytochrome P450 [Mycolicibacterium frederiksbergense]MDH6198609.1 cytochrome P450 [Mycolicibacterium frederiksbergense]